MSSEYGTFRLSYTPPATTGFGEYPNIAIEMTTDGSADVTQMLRFYEAFLAASGFILKGDLQVVEPEKESFDRVTLSGGGSSDFIPFDAWGGRTVLYGGAGADTISFDNWGSMPPSGISGAVGRDAVSF
jgi:hypothetical protein